MFLLSHLVEQSVPAEMVSNKWPVRVIKGRKNMSATAAAFAESGHGGLIPKMRGCYSFVETAGER